MNSFVYILQMLMPDECRYMKPYVAPTKLEARSRKFCEDWFRMEKA